MTRRVDKWVYYKGKMVKVRDMPFWRRAARMALSLPMEVVRRARKRRLGHWVASELDTTKEAK